MTTKPERRSLAALPFERKGAPPAAPAAEVEADAEADADARAFEPDDEPAKVPVMVRMRPSDRKLVRQIALGLDTTVQSLLEDAILDIIRRHRGAMNL